MSTLTPLALPDSSWAARLVDATDIMDGSRDAYSITIQVTDPDTARIRIWTRNHADALDAVTAFNATPDATATSELTLVWVRHWNGEPSVEIVTARPTAPALDGAA